MSKRAKYRAILNSDETPINMHSVVQPEPSGRRKSGAGKHKTVRFNGPKQYVVRGHKRVGVGKMPPPPNAQNRQVRVKVKTHDRARGAYKSSPVAVVNYVSKEGRTFDRARELDEGDRSAIKARWHDDRLVHHWMPSPEDGDKMTLQDVMKMTREMMDATERQTGRVDWFAGAERKNGSWHVHIGVRGVQDGKDMTLHPITERFWLRHHAEEATTDVLGWKGARTLEDERTRQERTRDLADERLERDRDRERDRNRDVSEETRERETRERETPSRHRGREMEMERER